MYPSQHPRPPLHHDRTSTDQSSRNTATCEGWTYLTGFRPGTGMGFPTFVVSNLPTPEAPTPAPTPAPAAAGAASWGGPDSASTGVPPSRGWYASAVPAAPAGAPIGSTALHVSAHTTCEHKLHKTHEFNAVAYSCTLGCGGGEYIGTATLPPPTCSKHTSKSASPRHNALNRTQYKNTTNIWPGSLNSAIRTCDAFDWCSSCGGAVVRAA